jgi:hypothetical protein
MASHAHSPGDSVSVAKLGLFGTIGAATIGAVTTLVVGMSNRNDVDIVPTGSTPTISAAPTEVPPDAGLRFSPVINGKLTVSGSAQKDVNGIYVVIGPKASGQYDTGYGNVVNQQWQAEVPTDPSWQQYPLVTIPYYGSSGVARSASAYKFTFQGTEPTTPPAPPPHQILDCAAQHGPSCFNGPGFGPPSPYHPNH